MPVSFLSPAQRVRYGRYDDDPCAEELARYFHLDDADRAAIAGKGGEHNRLGYAVQLTTVRFLGTFLEDLATVPTCVVQALGRQLGLTAPELLTEYAQGEQRCTRAEQIRVAHGYRALTDPRAGFALARWLYAQCWTGTDRPSALFDRATSWMLAQKVLLPGASVLERFVARLRDRVDARLCRLLAAQLSSTQRRQLEALLQVPPGTRYSALEKLRSGPVRVSGPSLVRALERLRDVRELGITMPGTVSIPPSRIAVLARFADKAKVSVVERLPEARRWATLVAFIHTLEASAQDDALEVFEMLIGEVFGEALTEDRKVRLRSLKDLDASATTLSEAMTVVVDLSIPDTGLREALFNRFPRDSLVQTLTEIGTLVRPPDDVFYQSLDQQHGRMRRFLPALLTHIHFAAGQADTPLLAALDYLRRREDSELEWPVPLDVVPPKWRRHVGDGQSRAEQRAYTFCVLDRLRKALHRRDVFVAPSWRYADPRSGLLEGAQWQATRPMICRTLALPPSPEPAIAALCDELEQTYRTVIKHLPQNPAVRFEQILSPLTAMKRLTRNPFRSVRVLVRGTYTWMTSVGIQRFLLSMVEDNIDSRWPDWAPAVCDAWRLALTLLETPQIHESHAFDWPIKCRLFKNRMTQRGLSEDTLETWSDVLEHIASAAQPEPNHPHRFDRAAVTLMRRRGSLGRKAFREATSMLAGNDLDWAQLDAVIALRDELCAMDLHFSELFNGIHVSLDRRALIPDQRMVTDQMIREAAAHPPADSRAALRGRWIRRLAAKRQSYKCNWHYITGPGHVYLDMSDPFAVDKLFERRDESRSTPEAGPEDARSAALTAYLAGDYAQAEFLLRGMRATRSEVPSTHCQLARLHLVQGPDRFADAGNAVNAAWQARTQAPTHIMQRILWLQLALNLLLPNESLGMPGPDVILRRFKRILGNPNCHMEWSMEPVLNMLQPRISLDQLALLTALVAALSYSRYVPDLERHHAWRGACPESLPLPVGR